MNAPLEGATRARTDDRRTRDLMMMTVNIDGIVRREKKNQNCLSTLKYIVQLP